ncbi:hypothetical protein [Streptacidiphilus cavernicola]|uniref:Uncharacterized protein n=1 Tax=Streptacidiphilus cavernicola TaxID=3342716 RepID=A0ABV6VYT6_9ACTN
MSFRPCAVVDFTGTTAAAALRKAARWCESEPEARVKMTGWMNVPGVTFDDWQYQLSLGVSYPDENGEYVE